MLAALILVCSSQPRAAAHGLFGIGICLDGKRAYQIGNICQTCAFFFERLSGANSSVEIEGTVDALKAGVSSLSHPVVDRLSAGLPLDDYMVCLTEARLEIVRPGQEQDYFLKEQIALWGPDTFWDLPHNPRVPYYRAGESDIGNHSKLFHFLIPMFPNSWLKEATISGFKQQFAAGGLPTAVTLSVLDVKSPSDWDENRDIREHWCLAHYLIDGHHKVAAAQESGHPSRLLNFLTFSKGVATLEQVETATSRLMTG